MGHIERLSSIKNARCLEVISFFLRAGRASLLFTHFLDNISFLIIVLGTHILTVSAGFELSRVVVRVPILGLPVGPHEAAGLLKICGLVDVLLAPLHLSFHATARLLPLAQIGLRLLITPLVSQLLIFVGEPHLLQLLLLDIRRRVVMEVVAAALKLVLRRELHLLLIIGVEGLVGWLESGALRLRKCTGGV